MPVVVRGHASSVCACITYVVSLSRTQPLMRSTTRHAIAVKTETSSTACTRKRNRWEKVRWRESERERERKKERDRRREGGREREKETEVSVQERHAALASAWCCVAAKARGNTAAIPSVLPLSFAGTRRTRYVTRRILRPPRIQTVKRPPFR